MAEQHLPAIGKSRVSTTTSAPSLSQKLGGGVGPTCIKTIRLVSGKQYLWLLKEGWAEDTYQTLHSEDRKTHLKSCLWPHRQSGHFVPWAKKTNHHWVQCSVLRTNKSLRRCKVSVWFFVSKWQLFSTPACWETGCLNIAFGQLHAEVPPLLWGTGIGLRSAPCNVKNMCSLVKIWNCNVYTLMAAHTSLILFTTD